MYTTESKPGATKPAKRSWRKHSDEFKARVIALALQPHASMASVALANGINANMLRRWVHASSSASAQSTANREEHNSQALSFVQLPMQMDKPMPTPKSPAPKASIELQIHRGDTRVVVSLPMVADSAAWLREVLG